MHKKELKFVAIVWLQLIQFIGCGTYGDSARQSREILNLGSDLEFVPVHHKHSPVIPVHYAQPITKVQLKQHHHHPHHHLSHHDPHPISHIHQKQAIPTLEQKEHKELQVHYKLPHLVHHNPHDPSTIVHHFYRPQVSPVQHFDEHQHHENLHHPVHHSVAHHPLPVPVHNVHPVPVAHHPVPVHNLHHEVATVAHLPVGHQIHHPVPAPHHNKGHHHVLHKGLVPHAPAYYYLTKPYTKTITHYKYLIPKTTTTTTTTERTIVVPTGAPIPRYMSFQSIPYIPSEKDQAKCREPGAKYDPDNKGCMFVFTP